MPPISRPHQDTLGDHMSLPPRRSGRGPGHPWIGPNLALANPGLRGRDRRGQALRPFHSATKRNGLVMAAFTTYEGMMVIGGVSRLRNLGHEARQKVFHPLTFRVTTRRIYANKDSCSDSMTDHHLVIRLGKPEEVSCRV